jgi:AhpD family alkylhydroperoxidase
MSDHRERLARERLTRGISIDGPLECAIADFAAAVVRAGAVDPLLRELVRLRCAQIHDCRLCGSLRTREAQEAGFDEDMQRRIARYESGAFSPAVVAALKLCDAIIMRPAWADAALKEELQRHFTAQQIAQICLEVMKWSQQKALVALRTEPPVAATLTELSFDDSGAPVFGGSVHAAPG